MTAEKDVVLIRDNIIRMIDKSNTDITKMEEVLRERLGKVQHDRDNIA
jgi:hypothetical protein